MWFLINWKLETMESTENPSFGSVTSSSVVVHRQHVTISVSTCAFVTLSTCYITCNRHYFHERFFNFEISVSVAICLRDILPSILTTSNSFTIHTWYQNTTPYKEYYKYYISHLCMNNKVLYWVCGLCLFHIICYFW